MPGTPSESRETGATSHRVAAHLRAAILGGTLGPGERIRQEDVAARMGASRLPVREALRMLEAEGLVENEPNKGARVPVLNAREVDLLYQMRERLEPLALTESVPKLTPGDITRLHDLQSKIEEGVDVGEFLRLDREFHLLTYSRCDIEPLSAMVTQMWNTTQHYRRAFMTVTGLARRWIVNAEHNLLLEAIERRDVVDAERCLQGHIRRTRVELLRHPEVFASGH